MISLTGALDDYFSNNNLQESGAILEQINYVQSWKIRPVSEIILVYYQIKHMRCLNEFST